MTLQSSLEDSASRDYEVAIEPLAGAESLKEDWLALQAQTEPPFFLCWLWISCWIDSFTPDALLLRISDGSGKQIAMGIFTQQPQRRHMLLHSRVALLHQTGRTRQDQIWVEYNGLIALPGHETTALILAVESLQQRDLCDEVHLSMLPAPQAVKLAAALNTVHVQYEVAGFSANLKTPRDQGRDWIDTLSRNTRHQVRRSLRLYETAHGPAALVPAKTTDEAIALFHEAGDWHRSRWSDSGYHNPEFIEFHTTLIKRGFDHGNVQLFRVVFGEHVIGVFYFLLTEHCVYFYLQGLRSESDNKLKPGLSSHCLLMQHFLQEGYDVYDFMGGESQYKHQLSADQNTFMTLRVHNGRWRFLLEAQARKIKHRLLGK